MKLDEFERKLATVADDKLLKMLGAARVDGPEVAERLIEAEAMRRGLEFPGKEKPASGSASTFVPLTGPASPEADARVRSAFAGLDRPLSEGAEVAPLEFQPEAPAPEGATAQGTESPGAWLNDELSKSRVPAFVKIIFYLGALGGLVAVLFKFLQKQ